MLRRAIFLVTLTSLNGSLLADDVCHVKHPHSLITYWRGDLVRLIQLNAHGYKADVRAYYQQVLAKNGAIELSPSDPVVDVMEDFGDGTVKITYNGRLAFIAKEDLDLLPASQGGKPLPTPPPDLSQPLQWGNECQVPVGAGFCTVQSGDERLFDGTYRHHIVFRQQDGDGYCYYTVKNIVCNGNDSIAEISTQFVSHDDYSMDDNKPDGDWHYLICQHQK